MTIAWHGYSCVSIEGKGKEVASILFDPFAPDGKAIRRVTDALVVLSSSLPEKAREDFLDKHPKAGLIDSPGEYDRGGAYFNAFTALSNPLRSIVSVTVDGMVVVFAGGLTKQPEDAFLERFDTVDVLLLPVGAGDGLAPKAAAAFARALEPHCVVPIRYKTARTVGSYEPLTVWLKEMGQGTSATSGEPRARFVKDEVRQAELRLVVLNDGQDE